MAYGQALMALDEPARAEQAFKAALQQAPLSAAARRLQGAFEGAEAALREALRLAPGHSAAKAGLVELERVRAGARPSPRPSAGARGDSDLDRQAAGGKAALNAWRPHSSAASVGLAVEYLSTKPAFAALPFGQWSQVLFHQVARGHYLFVVDQDRRIRGFVGWALTEERLAELWLAGGSGLTNVQCLDGDCVIVNAWSADTPDVNRFILQAMRKLFAAQRAVYYKRHYADGRERAVRLALSANIQHKSERS